LRGKPQVLEGDAHEVFPAKQEAFFGPPSASESLILFLLSEEGLAGEIGGPAAENGFDMLSLY
jgi:hypothetical protein